MFYSSTTVLVLMFFKLNSLSATIFYFYSSKLETRLLEFDNFSTPPKMFHSSATVLVLMFFQIKQSLCFYFFILTVVNSKTRLLEFVNFSVPPKILYSSATVLVLMFFKLNSLSALIFYFNDSKLEIRQGKEKSLHYTTEVQFMFWMFSAIFGLRLPYTCSSWHRWKAMFCNCTQRYFSSITSAVFRLIWIFRM